ncbi:MAG: glycosyltransferase family 61 protein [Alphaproteobacteria bacterium]|nr:glycosyltransferase family 61 protein [Alphaproteobacteria bacterium]
MPKVTSYCPQQVQWNLDHWNRDYKSDRKNTAEILNNGIIEPVVKPKDRPDFPRQDAGIFREDGSYVMGSNMWEPHMEMTSQLPENPPFADTALVWGGELINHYGHFLSQSTARIYYYLQNADKFDGIIFVWLWKFPIPDYMLDFLELCGIPIEKIKITNQVLKVRKLAVPSLSSLPNTDFTEDFLVPFKAAAANVTPGAHKKIYMSRKKLTKKKAETLGEDDVEKIFNKNGFITYCPETLPMREQIAITIGAEEIAGINGSALHNIVFGAGLKPKKIIMLNRTEAFNIQFMLNQAAGAECAVIKAYHNFLAVSHPNGPFIVGMTEYFRKFLKDNNMRDLGMKFRPQKYARKFLKKYMDMYSHAPWYQDLRDQKNNHIVEAADFINLIQLANFPRTRKFLWKIYSRIAPSRAARASAKYQYDKLERIYLGTQSQTT